LIFYFVADVGWFFWIFPSKVTEVVFMPTVDPFENCSWQSMALATGDDTKGLWDRALLLIFPALRVRGAGLRGP
jgi:hypothetical protein